MSVFLMDGKEVRVNGDLTWRDINDELVALNTKTGDYITFNRVGRLAWLAIAEGKTLDELTDQVLREFSIDDRNKAVADIRFFVDNLIQKGVASASETGSTAEGRG